ncbi:MAG TPA: OmpA family protein [Candidatus Eisenbacteria bacterium]|nr:OmpA family protein [Candidatus Eisenbacteria bacterium]
MSTRSLAGIGSILAATLLLGAAGARAAGTTLNAVLYPEGEKAEVKFQTTERAPKAQLTGTVTSKQGQSQIAIAWSKLQPALLFGGDVNCWVLWSVTPDGTVYNLGELPVRQDMSGKASFSGAYMQFALMVTAEPLPIVRRPSDLVVFTSMPSALKNATNTPFEFAGFRTGTNRTAESIADSVYKDKAPVELLQARKAVELMDRYQAEKYAAQAATDAKAGLAQAEDAFSGKAGKKSEVPQLSTRTVALASEALRAAITKIETQKLQDVEAQRLAELSQKQAETEAERAARLKTEADLVKTQAEKMQIEADRAQIQRDRDMLAQQLSGALGKVSATERTGRGLVVSMSGGILFGSGKAALKPDAKIALAKLSGILLMIPNKGIQIEGHTDATGAETTNARLSLERATAVKEFLKSQGVDESRIAATGLGSTKPVAPDDTADGRAKNRRVEIVIPE